MTPQEIDRREENHESQLSTAELAAGNGGSALPSPGAEQEPNVPLFVQSDTQDFRQRWERIQIGFVDEPRKAVQQADELVATAMKKLAVIFAAERGRLEEEWNERENVSTEDLRLALRRYRSFFDRLLSV
jgi:hypothetical protein